MIGSALRLSAVWLILAALYILFAGEFSLAEIIAGLLATGVASGYAVVLHRSRRRVLMFQAPWPRVVMHPLAALAPDAWRVGRVLLRSLWQRPAGSAGMVSRQRFREGERDPKNAGRRGLVTLELSLAPNGYVLDIESEAIVLHRLAPGTSDSDREWPV